VASVSVTFASSAAAPCMRSDLPLDIVLQFIHVFTVKTSGVPGITGCYQAQGSTEFFIPYLLLFILELGMLHLVDIYIYRDPLMLTVSTSFPHAHTGHPELANGLQPFILRSAEA